MLLPTQGSRLVKVNQWRKRTPPLVQYQQPGLRRQRPGNQGFYPPQGLDSFLRRLGDLRLAVPIPQTLCRKSPNEDLKQMRWRNATRRGRFRLSMKVWKSSS